MKFETAYCLMINLYDYERRWNMMEKYIGTIIVAAIIIIVCVLAIRSMIKDKKSGKSVQCGGNCNNCHGCH